MCIAVKLTANVEIQISVPIVNIHSVLCWTVLTYKTTLMTKTNKNLWISTTKSNRVFIKTFIPVVSMLFSYFLCLLNPICLCWELFMERGNIKNANVWLIKYKKTATHFHIDFLLPQVLYACMIHVYTLAIQLLLCVSSVNHFSSVYFDRDFGGPIKLR